MSRKLTINWIFDYVGLSGGVKSNRLIAEAMVRRGHEVNLVYCERPDQTPPIWRVRSYLKHKKKERESQGKQQHHLESSTANLLPVAHRPLLASDVPDADFTVATWWRTAVWMQDWPANKGVKGHFVRHHEVYGGDPDEVEAVYRMPIKKFVIARWLKTLMADSYGDSSAALVPNGVDWNQFNYQPREKNSVPAVGFLYGVANWKGAELAFTAVRKMQEIIPELKVYAFGSHLIDKKFNDMLPANFEYFYKPSQKEIPEIYRKTDCWLMPSTLEGFGMPGLEAAACGCPVVSTLCGGPEDYVVPGENGYLVAVNDADAMSEHALKILTADPQAWLVMSKNSARIAEEFDWDKSAEKLERAMLEAIE
ncbi:glycosyltransferase family 4 protein [Teredinibacter turnerae]|uniref:glycosyltransferase family 4 protein n=1 Tax=Teredinibacter turnerae TaxID=2426 RepID=UPI0003810726|nr:glycosyltransferase family 4 protein [Teredinibacter turnerae]